MLSDTVGEEDGELEEDLSPVLNPARPLADDIHRRQIEHLEQGFIRWKYALALRDFTKRAVVALDHIGGEDEFADLWRILGPPDFLKPVKLQQCQILRCCFVDGL